MDTLRLYEHAGSWLMGNEQEGRMDGTIEVRLYAADAPKTPHGYFEWVERECRKAGVPFSDGEPENGVLYRRDDPNDFGCSIWVYRPHN